MRITVFDLGQAELIFLAQIENPLKNLFVEEFFLLSGVAASYKIAKRFYNLSYAASIKRVNSLKSLIKQDYDLNIDHGPRTVFDLSQGGIFCDGRSYGPMQKR